jgi:hypothetical protein
LRINAAEFSTASGTARTSREKLLIYRMSSAISAAQMTKQLRQIFVEKIRVP